jgi:hypothetical protein
MTLTLRLNGVRSLLSQLSILNKNLDKLDSNFAKTGNSMLNTVNRLTAAVQSVKNVRISNPSVARPQPAPRNSNNSGGGGNPNYSAGGKFGLSNHMLLSSLMSGDLKNIAKALVKSAIVPIARSVATNQAARAVPGGVGPPVPPDMMISSLLLSLGEIGVVILAIVGTLKLFKEIVDASSAAMRTQRELYYSAGGNDSYQPIKKLGESLNLDPSEVASEVSASPGKGNAFIEKLKALRAMSDEQAAYYMGSAGAPSIKWAGIRQMSDADFNNAISNRGGIEPITLDTIAEYDKSLGDLQKTMTDLKVALVPLIKVANLIAKAFNFILNPPHSPIWQNKIPIQDLKDKSAEATARAAKDMREAAREFKNGVDGFTNRTGPVGGGRRGSHSMPAGWGYMSNQQYLIDHAENLGAFDF